MCSEGLAKLAVWLCGHVTAEVAEQILDQIGGVVCSGTSLWRRVAKWGEKIRVGEAARQAVANALPSRGSVVPVAPVSSKDMGAFMDGIQINVRGEGGKELKVGCVFEIEMHPAPDAKTEEMVEHARAVNNSYLAHLGEPAPFGRALWAEACRREMPQARDSVVLGDGAAWIWNLAGEHFAGSRQVVDWYHATEHLSKAAHLAYGEGSAEAMRWAKGMETPLYQGHAWKVGAAVRELAKHHRRVAKALRAEAGYFEHNQRRMQYLEMREEGFPIGSGMVESGGKQFRTRLAGAGMR